VTQQQQVQRDLQHLFNRILKGYAPAEAAISDMRSNGVRIGKHVVRQLKGIKLRDLHTHLHALSHTKLFIKAYVGHTPSPPKQLLKLLQAWGVHVDLPEVPTGPVGRWGHAGSAKGKGTAGKGKLSGAGALARAGSATPAASTCQTGEQQGVAGSEDEAGSEVQQAGSAVKQEEEAAAAGAVMGTPGPAGSITPAATLPAPRSSASGSALVKSLAFVPPSSKGLSTAALAQARQAVDRKIVEMAEQHMTGMGPAAPSTLRLLVQVSAAPACLPAYLHADCRRSDQWLPWGLAQPWGSHMLCCMATLCYHLCCVLSDFQIMPLPPSFGSTTSSSDACSHPTHPSHLSTQVSLVPYRAPGLPDLPKGFRKRKLELIPPELIIANESTTVGELKAMVAEALSYIYRWGWVRCGVGSSFVPYRPSYNAQA
jgi:hypothetical protein